MIFGAESALALNFLQVGDVHLEITIDRVGIVVADLNLQSIGRSKDAPGEMGVIRGDVQILRGRRAVLLVGTEQTAMDIMRLGVVKEGN